VARRKPPTARRKPPKGWTEGSVQDLLGLTDGEAAIVEMRVRLAERVRATRQARRVTQQELARRIRSTQPRVARLEQADASMELLIRALLALGASRKQIGRLLAA
jgi:ribosome-binding protein aMBF1 (putative translation factor)